MNWRGFVRAIGAFLLFFALYVAITAIAALFSEHLLANIIMQKLLTALFGGGAYETTLKF